MFNIENYRAEWVRNVRGDLLSGLVVALALVPEAIAFSIIAGVDPKVGLYASVVIAIVISIFGGRPAMISAATAATAVLFGSLVRQHGLDYLLAATILAGLLQIGAGYLKLHTVMRFVSKSVMTGFVNALAILIFMAQLPELIGVPMMTYPMVALALAVIYLFPRVTTLVPSPLVAIIVVGLVVFFGGLDVHLVGDMGELPTTLPFFLIPNVPLTLDMLWIILPYSVGVAAVGLLESLMTAQIIDEFTDTPSDKRQESIASSGGGGDRPYFGSIPDYSDEVDGLALTGVSPGGPAEKAGVKGGDVIVQFGESKIGGIEDFQGALLKHKPGDKVKVKIKRAGETVELEVTLGKPRG